MAESAKSNEGPVEEADDDSGDEVDGADGEDTEEDPEAEPDAPTLDAEDGDADAPIFDTDDSDRSGLFIVGGVILAGLLLLGGMAELSGMGWFGYRPILYGSGDLYLLNMSDEELEVSVEGGDRLDVDPEGARAVGVVGGESEVVVSNKDGDVVDEHTVFLDRSHGLLKLTPDGCLATSDVSSFYGRDGDGLKIADVVAEDERFYSPGTTNVIWPRESFPEKLEGDGDAVWIELVGCALLEDREFLEGYLDVRLGDRLDKVE